MGRGEKLWILLHGLRNTWETLFLLTYYTASQPCSNQSCTWETNALFKARNKWCKSQQTHLSDACVYGGWCCSLTLHWTVVLLPQPEEMMYLVSCPRDPPSHALPLCLTFTLSFTVSLSLSFSHTHTCTHTRTHKLSKVCAGQVGRKGLWNMLESNLCDWESCLLDVGTLRSSLLTLPDLTLHDWCYQSVGSLWWISCLIERVLVLIIMHVVSSTNVLSRKRSVSVSLRLKSLFIIKFFSLPRSFSRSLLRMPLECLLSPLLRMQWDSCLMEFISDMCSQLDAGSRSTNPLTNVPHIFRMMFQHVLLIAPHPHPLLFFSCVYVCFYRQEVTSSQLSFLSLPLAAPLISSPSSCSQTHCA